MNFKISPRTQCQLTHLNRTEASRHFCLAPNAIKSVKSGWLFLAGQGFWIDRITSNDVSGLLIKNALSRHAYLREHGVEANAAPRRTRGVTRRYAKQAIVHLRVWGDAGL
jgi:hypothetical protein